jgi:predicted metal-dependent enzyme (double-stranded beta helix superfamily)
MSYTLQQFSVDTKASLKASPLAEALSVVAGNLARLLDNPDFVAATFDDETPIGKRELFHDAETDFYVLAHVQEPGKGGTPHSHGVSWAVYGNAREVTEMTEYRRLNAQSEENAVLEVSDRYELAPGQTRAYGPGVIHSTAHPRKAWVVRVTGTDLDRLQRYHFSKSRDRLVESV